jgi:hypothetical protein
MAMTQQKAFVRVAAEFQPLFRLIGFDPAEIFTNPQIKPWRKLSDRENCTWDVFDEDDQPVRLHVKRYKPADISLADNEAAGLRLLEQAKIPAAKLVAWGMLRTRQTFVIVEDLAGFEAADKLIESGTPFEKLLIPTADIAAKLHGADLHHCDLYLCHFFVSIEAETVDVRLIDAARVTEMRSLFTRRRWIVKDLAQFWFSTLALPITDDQRARWLARYGEQRKLQTEKMASLRRSIERKAKSIAAHDKKLRAKEPLRNISIPKRNGM